MVTVQEHTPACWEEGLIRDQRYWQTLQSDLRRQKNRRLAKRMADLYEQYCLWPRWKRPLGNTVAKPTLSTCIMTMNSADRIVPLLRYIRAFSDEIVVGVDSKTTDNTLDICQGLADELFIIESDALTCNAGLETLVRRCHGDWVLRLDDDEFPEPRFAEFYRAILSTTHYTHFKLPRLHLAQTQPLLWIDDSYLYPDYQLRLFKNQLDLLTFPGPVGHKGIECRGPKGRLNTLNLVHLNLAINPRWKREEKLKTYIKRLNGAWVHPVNEYALMFEDFDYQMKSYHYPDTAFQALLTDTIMHQQACYASLSL
jgi:glycosyltransferase involved in cell wall biosynthesis